MNPLDIAAIHTPAAITPQKSVFDTFTNFVNTRPEVFALVTDALGSRIAPQNPFAGIGSSLAKSSLASKAADEDKAKTENFISQLVNALSDSTQAGPEKLSVKRNPDGSLAFNLGGQLDLPTAASGDPLAIAEDKARKAREVIGGF